MKEILDCKNENDLCSYNKISNSVPKEAFSVDCLFFHDYKQESRTVSFKCRTLFAEACIQPCMVSCMLQSHESRTVSFKILICDDDGETYNTTTNMVYDKIFKSYEVKIFYTQLCRICINSNCLCNNTSCYPRVILRYVIMSTQVEARWSKNLN